MTVFELLGKIVINNTEANNSIDNTMGKVESLKKTFGTIGQGVIDFGNGAMKYGGMIAAAWAGTVEGSREYRTEMGKLNAAFTAAGHTAETATATYKTLYGVIGETDQAVEAAQKIAMIAKSEKDVAEWAELAAGVAGLFGDSLMPEAFFESANATIKLGEAQEAYVQMLEESGMSVDGFNAGLAACSTEAERQAYTLAAAKAALSEAGKAYNENNKDIIEANRAQGDLTDTMAKIGEITEPAMTKVKDSATQLVETALPSIERFMTFVTDNGQAVSVAIGTIAAAMGVAAVTAHPYAAAVLAVATGLAALYSVDEARSKDSHLLDNYTDEELAVLQRYVDSMNELTKAEDAFEADGGVFNDAATERLRNAQAAAAAATKEAEAVDGLLDTYNEWANRQDGHLKDAMYLDVPPRLTEEAESDIQAELDGMSLEASVKMIPDMSAVYAAQNQALTFYSNVTGNSVPISHAVGLDEVPYDGYYAHLHKGEAILNKVQADQWRGGNSGKVEALLSQVVTLLAQQKSVVLDSGAVVGQLAPAMDARLGTLGNRKGRRN